MAAGGGFDTDSRTAWISQGFERLIDRVRKAPNAVHFDVLIVGSGYGGAVAAATFAGRRSGGTAISVGVLERGDEYLPGSFPTGLDELPGHIRHSTNKEGLFDVRLGGEVATVVANGVGGGSLINAGVMLAPSPGVFASGWPTALQDLSTWGSYFGRASDLLGASFNGIPNTIVDHVDGVPNKFQAFEAIAPAGAFRPAPITIAMKDSVSSGCVSLNKCLRCGDCATGCNFGAKNSLDVNLLVRALQAGAEIFKGATVLGLANDAGGNWIVKCVHTSAPLRKRDSEAVEIRARKVVLAAGTLGSTEILMRSRDLGLQVSTTLGTRCSTNGDMLIVDYATTDPVHTVADETVKPSDRGVGPTITGVADLRGTAGVVIEEISVPAALRIAFTEVFATVNALHGIAEADTSQHVKGCPNDDLYVAPAARIERSALYAVMGDDGAAGSIELDDASGIEHPDGMARLHWKSLQDRPLFDAEVDTVAGLTERTGGRLIPNPVWKLLPTELTWLLQNKRGPLTTVHPLGGCAMADSIANGVVDHLGRVFSKTAAGGVHDGLVVLDGSIIPTALGANPALTISAVALRAAEALAIEWGYADGPVAAGAPLTRPVFRSTNRAAPPSTTEVEVIERLAGPVTFAPSGGPEATRIVELTLRFSSTSLAQLTPGNGAVPTLLVASGKSERAIRSAVRIFPLAEWDALQKCWTPPRLLEQKLDAIAEFSAPVTGSLRLFERQSSSVVERIWRAGTAWILNRGLRDAYQAVVDGDDGPGLWSRIKSGLAIASRAGEVRTFVYDLTIGPPDTTSIIALAGNRITGFKSFTYMHRGNPWRQLMEVAIDTFPGASSTDKGVLKLDPRFLARIGVPLARLTQQRNAITGLGDLVSFLGYFVRLLIGLHIWSFRAPDKDTDPGNDDLDLLPPKRLALPGVGGPVDAETLPPLTMLPETPEGALNQQKQPGEVLLTHYPCPNSSKRPLVMLHGYSAGGTTFAHRAVDPNFASYFRNSGRDIWIADLRTSSGQPTTAILPWSFDQIGLKDVPAIIVTAAAKSIDGKVDVIAHCMGTVVFSIAVLNGKLDERIGRAAFTQVGPLVVFTPANIFRAYVTRYFVNFLPDHYSFSPTAPTLADDLLDRLLSTLPYPIEEFDVENPVWPCKRTPWTRTRHRMDALYGRDFNAVNMESEMLRFINEHFGALSLKTVASTVHFARYSLMTNFHGLNNLVSRKNFADHWDFPTLSVHGADNGLADVSTVDRMRQLLSDAGCHHQTYVIPGAGHQDALVGTTRYAALARIEQFLDDPNMPGPGKPSEDRVAYAPWIGPIITEERCDTPALVVRVGALPSLRSAEAILMLRITAIGDQILRPDDPAKPWDLSYLLDHLVVYMSNALSGDRWAAFEAPLPTSMPNYDPAHPGNALLVLLVYGESKSTAALAFNYFRARNKKVFAFSPIGPPEEPVNEAKELKFDVFERMAVAAEQALAPYNVDPNDNQRGTPRRLVYRGLRQTHQPTNTSTQLDLSYGMAAQMLFSYGGEQEAALGALEQDRDLTDAVIPYDPQPAQPPSPATTSFTLASCQYPAGFIDEPVAYRSYQRIVERLTAAAGTKPRFSIFVGDQVYVDATAGLFDPAAIDDRYRLPYEAWLRQHHVRGVLRRIPSFMLLDDHEIDNDWEPVDPPYAQANNEMKTSGVDSYEKYQRGRQGGCETFDFDGFRFFLLDTRTERTHRKVGQLANATLFDRDPSNALKTMGRLQTWLLQGNTAPKFVVSPSMLLPRHRRAIQRDTGLDPSNLGTLHSDGWDGYPNTLREVLAFIAYHKIGNVVFLSGDEHRGCVATIELRDMADAPIVRLHSIHTAALYAPFPFANSLDEDIIQVETIDIVDPIYGSFRCKVSATRPPPGDGATFLTVRKDGTAWKLDYEFSDQTLQTLSL